MSTSTRKLKRGEIYYIQAFPTCGSEQRAGRPAVIVSNNECNSSSSVIEVCYLTLKEKPNLPTHVFIDQGPCINSTVLCEQITSVAIDRIGDYMCTLPEYLKAAIDNALMESLALLPIPTVGVQSTIISASENNEKMFTKAMMENKTLKDEIVALKHKLDLAKDANATIKEKFLASQSSLDSANARADMYERMYNDLLDRLLNRGAK